jgi:hypothetical protein
VPLRRTRRTLPPEPSFSCDGLPSCPSAVSSPGRSSCSCRRCRRRRRRLRSSRDSGSCAVSTHGSSSSANWIPPCPPSPKRGEASSCPWPRPLRLNIYWQEQTSHMYISVKTAAKKDATAAAPLAAPCLCPRCGRLRSDPPRTRRAAELDPWASPLRLWSGLVDGGHPTRPPAPRGAAPY